jgi:ubiquinone/menaquinone biosynthesis C-methylase UbiE
MTTAEAIDRYTVADIEAMDYNQIIGLVRETNRPPGGSRSISKIAQEAFLRPESRVLEVGTSTGFTAIELARLVGCHISAIDINPLSCEEARTRGELFGVSSKIDFSLQDATCTNFEAASFDLVFCGNVTSLIANREKALQEYIRVLKDNGFVAAIPMYYVKEPAAALLDRVSSAIKVNVVPLRKPYWVEFFERPPLQLYWSEDYLFDHITDDVIDRFVESILARKHLLSLRPDAQQVLSRVYRDFMCLFRDNLSHMGYTLLMLRKEHVPIDRELFVSRRAGLA